jgi:energy-coupling factor transport system ATP-binding protein
MPDELAIESLRFAYPPLRDRATSPWVIDGLDLHAGAGEWLAVMGANDSGKTTLCLLVSALAPSLTGGVQEGRVYIGGQDTREHYPPALAATTGIVFQDPEAQLFNPTVETEIAWGLENLGLPRPEMRERLEAALTRFRLEALRHRSPNHLSGGEKKRLALASVLAMQPWLLVLDEPMGGLDPAGRAEVLSALSELRRAQTVTILMTESDPEAVAAFADRLAILGGGRFALEGTPRSLFPQAEQLGKAGVPVPQMARLAEALNRCTGSAFGFLTVDEAREAIVQWLGERASHPLPTPPPSDEGEGGGLVQRRYAAAAATAVEVQGLRYWYADEQAPALRGVDLSIGSGEFVALVGANGSGKTTLVKHFNGLLRPRWGSVRLFGQDTAGRSIGELAHQVGFLFQSPEQQIFCATVWQEVAFGPKNLALPPAEVEQRVNQALARFGLTAVADHPPAILSYGLRRRVTLASLAAMDPPVLVLDEPTVGLDAAGRDETVHWLRERHSAGRSVVLVTHDMALVADCAERVVVLCRGEIVADGAPSSVFEDPELLRRASLEPPPVVALAQALWPFGLAGTCLTVHSLCDALVSRRSQA